MPRPATARKRDPDSPGAERTRQYRWRQMQGEILAMVPVPESYRALFVAEGLLDGWCQDDREAIADAVRAILDLWKLEKAAESAEFPEVVERDDPSL